MLKLQVDPGGEWLLPFCKRQLAELKKWMREAGITNFVKNLVFSTGERAQIYVYEYGIDRIRITAAASTAAHALGTVRLLGANGRSVFASEVLPEGSILIGISGNGRFTFVLSIDASVPVVATLYVFKDNRLYQTLTHSYSGDATAIYIGYPNQGTLNGGSLVSYDGTKAIIPVAVHSPSNGYGCLMFDDSADPKLRYFITPSTVTSINDLQVPFIGTPDLSTWGWFDFVGNTSTLHLFDTDDNETQTVITNTGSVLGLGGVQGAVFSQNGTLVLWYHDIALNRWILSVGGVVNVLPASITDLLMESIYPWMVSSDASKIVVHADPDFVLEGAAVTLLPYRPMCISLDGSTYAQYDSSSEWLVRLTRTTGNPPVTTNPTCSGFWWGNGNPHTGSPLYAVSTNRPRSLGWFNTGDPDRMMSGVLSEDGTALRHVKHYGGKQDTYNLNDAGTNYDDATTVTLEYTGEEYDNIYTKVPPL